MASDLNLLKSFVDGEGAGASTFVTYAENHDSNYTAIENGFNTLNAEVKAFAGQNAVLVIDLITSSSPLIVAGIIGADSFDPVAFITGDTQMQVPVGVAYTASVGRVQSGVTFTLTGSGSSGTRYAALQANGTITLETATSQGVMDLYSVTWTGTVFTPATLAKLPAIMPDGDDFQNQRIQEDFGQGSDTAIPAFTYERIADRLSDIVRILGADLVSADAGQAALNPIAIGGSIAAPGLIVGDGATYDATTGLYGDPTSSFVGVSVLGTETMRFDETVADQPQALLRQGTSLTEPPLAFIGHLVSGLGYVATNQFRAIAGSLEAMQWFKDGTDPKALFVGGSAATVPGLAVIGDTDTGLGGDGSNLLRMITGGVLAADWNSNQQRNSATQGRCSATRAVFNIANNTITAVELTTEQYDQGAYHDNATNPDRMTVPTGHNGNFSVKATVTYDESSAAGGGTANTGDRGTQITLNGGVVAEERKPAAAAGDSSAALSVDLDLVATDIVRVTAFQDAGGTMDVSGRLTVRHED